MKRTENVLSRGIIAIVGTAVALGMTACDDPFEDQDNFDGAATLFSLSRDDQLYQPSALDLRPSQALGSVVVEEIGNTGWDVALAEGDDGFVLLPAGAVQAQGGGAIFMDEDHTFEERTEAPGDAEVYIDNTSVPLQSDAVYVVRTRGAAQCDAYFAKLHATEIDETLGSVRFEFIVNPNCSGRNLEPPPDDGGDDD